MNCKYCNLPLSESEPYVTVFDAKTMEPKEYRCDRCDVRLALLEFQKSGILTSRLTMAASLARFYYKEADDKSRWRLPALTEEECVPVCNTYDEIHTVVKDFERDVWFGGMQKQVQDCELKGLSYKGDDWTMLVYAIAGRCSITLNDDLTDQSITVITVEDEAPFAGRKYNPKAGMGPMGINGIYSTKDTAIRLLQFAISNWPLTLEPHEKVNMGF